MTTPPKLRKLKAKIVDVKDEFNGFLSIKRVTIEHDRHEGGTDKVERLIMDRGHAVAVLAYDPVRDEVVLVNEMRPGILWAGEYPFTNNLIAGGINKGETATEAAVRETTEEAGLTLKDPVVVNHGAYVSSGGTSEKIAIVAGVVDASKAGGVHGCANESEDIRSTIMKAEEFIRQVRTGEMNDLKTIVAGYWLQDNRPALQLKYGVGKKAASVKRPTDASPRS